MVIRTERKVQSSLQMVERVNWDAIFPCRCGEKEFKGIKHDDKSVQFWSEPLFAENEGLSSTHLVIVVCGRMISRCKQLQLSREQETTSQRRN